MSATLFDLEAVLSLNSKQYKQGLDDAEKQASTAGSSIGTSIKKGVAIATAALTAATTAAVKFGQSAINAASSFESAFTGVKKTVDATEEEYKELADWIMEASTKMAASKESIAATMEIAGQLGIRGVEGLEKFTETMVMLGDTTNLNAEEAAGSLARFSNITGISAEQADKIGSVIVALGNNFATTESDIVSMATRLAGAGTQFGLTGAEILGIATALSSVGIQAEMGGSAFSKAMIKMQVAAETGFEPVNELLKFTGAKHYIKTLRELELAVDQSPKFLKTLGAELGKTTDEISATIKAGSDLANFAKTANMSVEDFISLFREDSTAALQAFIKGLGDTDTAGESTIQMLQEMGFTEVRLRDTLTRLSGSGDLLTNSVTMANTAFEENVALINEATLRYGTMESQALQTSESFKNLQVTIGQELLPVYGQLMSFTREAMNSMEEGMKTGGLSGFMASFGTAFSQGLTAAFQAIPTLMEAGGALLGALGQGVIDNLPTFLTTATQIVSSLGGYIVESAPTLIPAAVQLLADLSSMFIEQLPTLIPLGASIIGALVDGIAAAIPVFLEQAPLIIEQFAQAVIDAVKEISPTLGGIFETLFGWITENGEVVLSLIIGIATAFKAFSIIGSITKLIMGIIPALQALFTVLLANPIGLIVAAVAGLIAIIVTLWNTNDDFKNAILKAWGAIKDFFSGIGNWFGEKFGQVKEKITDLKNHAKEKFSQMKQNTSDAMEKMGEKINAVWQGVRDNPLVQSIVDFVKNSFETLKKALFGIWDGIKQEAGGAWEIIKNVVLGPVLLLCDLVTGDFDKLKEDALNIMKNLGEGLKNFFLGLFQILKSIFVGAWENLKNLWKLWTDGIWTALKNLRQKLKEITSNFFEAVKNFFINIGKWIKNKLDEYFGFWNKKVEEIPVSIEDAVQNAIDFLKELPGKALQWGKDLIDNFVNGILSVGSKVKDAISGVAQGIRDFLHFSEPDVGPLADFHEYAPDMIDLFVQGIKDNQKYLQNAVADAFNFEPLIKAPSADFSGQNGANRGNNYYINVNQPVSTPADMLREIRTEAQYGLMIGEALV